MRGPTAAAMRAPVAAEPVKKTPSTFCSTSAAPKASRHRGRPLRIGSGDRAVY
jgi:hypothetical protein